MMDMQMIPMEPRHVEPIVALERQCFSDPWSERSVASELKNSLSLWLVAEQDGTVCGYVGSQSVLGEADVMNLAVSPACRRQGLGRSLMLALEQRLREKDVECLTLEVRVSNDAALGLYKALGYQEVGRRPNYYFHPQEDALILRKALV